MLQLKQIRVYWSHYGLRDDEFAQEKYYCVSEFQKHFH